MLNNIQISRGIAASIVVLAHANLLIDKNLFDGFLIMGWCGVDFFFVLSGFIIYYTNKDKFGKLSEVPSYFAKRLKRVYPVYWLYTLFAIFLNVAAFLAVNKTVTNWADMSVLGMLRNFLLLPTDVPANIMPILPVAWTLTYEILFYLLFGLALMVRRTYALVVLAIWVILILARFLNFIEPSSPTTFLYILSNSHNLEFLFGCIAAYLFTEYGEKFSIKTSTIMLLGGFLLLTGSWINGYRDFIWFSNVEFIQFGIPFFLIVLGVSALDIKKPIANNSAQRIAVFLGDASYSIYLTHFIVIQICSFALNKFIQVPTIYSFYISVLASFLIGCGSYILIEKPLMKKLSKKTPHPLLLSPTGVMRE